MRDDNGPIIAGKIIETTDQGIGESGAGIALDVATIAGSQGEQRLGNQLGTGTQISTLVLEPGGGDGGGDGRRLIS